MEGVIQLQALAALALGKGSPLRIEIERRLGPRASVHVLEEK